VQSFIVIGQGVLILWGVKVWPFPLDCDVAVNTDGRPPTCDTGCISWCTVLGGHECHTPKSCCPLRFTLNISRKSEKSYA